MKRAALTGSFDNSQTADAVEREADLHEMIINECKRRGWHPGNSRMDLPTTRDPGEPDFRILADGGRNFLIECKTGKGKLSIAQQSFAMMAEKNGHKVHVVRSYQEFLQIINQ